MKTYLAVLGSALVVILAVFVIKYDTTLVQGAAPSGLSATAATTTLPSVGPQNPVKIFDSNATCASRVIRTQGVGITLVLSNPTTGVGTVVSSSTVSAIVGFIQGASTTVAYDGGLYGCGEVWGFAESSTTLTAAEYR